LSWPLAIALLVAAPAVTPLINRATRQIKKASRRAQQRTAEAASNADEIIDNMRIIRVFGAESLQLKRYQSKINASHAANKDVINLQAVLDISGRVRNTLCIMATLCLGAYLTLSGHVTIGVCYSFFVYSFSFAFALSNLSATLGELSKAAGTVSRTLAVLKRAAFDDDNADEGGKESVAHLNLGESQVSRSTDDEIVNGLNGHDIEFRDVSFVHPSGWQLQNVNIDLPKGSTVALIGPSGGGKSTIASLLLGFYKPTSGEILINGQSLQNLDLSWWRRQVGAVEQFPGLISGPIRDVVAYGNPCATDEHIETALKDAQASDFMAKLPITMDASALSGGQKQRIALARAYARHPKVLILDEATSALDSRTEDGVAAVLRKRRADKPLTTLIIAHRLSTIKDADSVVIVADGRVLKQAWGQDKDEIIDNLMAGNRNLQLQDRTLIN
jgi:ABC-type multidrug transport system fused ATPase/permease subunit